MANIMSFDFDKYFEENRKSFSESWNLWKENVSKGIAGVVEEGSSWYLKTGMKLKFGESDSEVKTGNADSQKLNV